MAVIDRIMQKFINETIVVIRWSKEYDPMKVRHPYTDYQLNVLYTAAITEMEQAGPDAKACSLQHEGYHCTRPFVHNGAHVAVGANEIVALWPGNGLSIIRIEHGKFAKGY